MRSSFALSPCALAIGALFASAALASSTELAAPADNPKDDWLPLGLQSYEPSAFGYTKNNNDVHFENIKLSVKYPLMPAYTRGWWGPQDKLFLSFTGLWGFYIGDRSSDPVVGKEYNPQFFWQHLWRPAPGSRLESLCRDPAPGGYEQKEPTYPNKASPAPSSSESPEDKPLRCYVTVGYNHDSNGQIINDPRQYDATAQAQGVEAARDAISRGWDYIGVTAELIPHWGETKVTVYPILKYFMNDGLLQGVPEELHSWEHPADGKPRKAVDGLSVLVKATRHLFDRCDGKLVLGYTTGYSEPFRYSTVRAEAGIKVLELPIVVWAQRGYVADLAQWYRNVTGYGIQFEIGAF
ncbi:MAG TPA: hypothetical protein VET46_16005 [Steroidobacteraceae bacterium]|nr:hypothetical protein [Steroidobacteraceae bacterium]